MKTITSKVVTRVIQLIPRHIVIQTYTNNHLAALDVEIPNCSLHTTCRSIHLFTKYEPRYYDDHGSPISILSLVVSMTLFEL